LYPLDLHIDISKLNQSKIMSQIKKAFEFGKFLKICGFLAFDYKEGDWFKKAT